MDTAKVINKNLFAKIIEAVSYVFGKSNLPYGDVSTSIRETQPQLGHINPLDYSLIHNASFKVITKWRFDTKYEYVKAKKILDLEEGEISFKKLVEEVDNRCNFREILNNLLSIGVIDYSVSEKQVKLIKDEYIPLDNQEEIIKILQNDISDIIDCVTKNLALPQNKVYHQLRTEYDGIPKCKEEEVKQWISYKASKLHREIGEYLASFDIDLSKNNVDIEETVTVSFSSFNNVKNNIK